MSKNVVEPEGPQITSQYGAYELHAGKARLHARTRMSTPTRTSTHTDAHEEISNTYCFSSATRIRESASKLRYAYIACLVIMKLGHEVWVDQKQRHGQHVHSCQRKKNRMS